MAQLRLRRLGIGTRRDQPGRIRCTQATPVHKTVIRAFLIARAGYNFLVIFRLESTIDALGRELSRSRLDVARQDIVVPHYLAAVERLEYQIIRATLAHNFDLPGSV